jgi:23S rRNA (uracil1939-C5)-methyltransferase
MATTTLSYGVNKNSRRSNGRSNFPTSSSSPNHIEIPESLTHKRNQTPLNCPHFNECPGCITSKSYDDIPTIQSAKLFFSRKGKHNEDFYQTVLPSEISHYRTQAKLVVRSKSAWGRNGCIFGLYERKSHNLVEIPNCVVHHPSINEAVDVLSKATEKVGTVGFNSDSHDSKGLRYVQLQVERKTGKICMTLIWNGEDLKSCQPDLSRLIKACKKINGSLFHSIWCHTNASLGNSIFIRGERNWHPMDGPEFVREVLPGTSVDDIKNRRGGLLHFTPMAFRQGNMDGFDAITMHVAKAIPGGSKVCELYAGIGVLGLTALSYHSKSNSNDYDDDDWYNDDDGIEQRSEPLTWLRCSDENPANPRCFQRTVNSMPSEVTGRISMRKQNKMKKGLKNKKHGDKGNSEKTMAELMEDIMNDDYNDAPSVNPRKGKVSYMVASAAKALHEGQALGADVIIVDPPRKGLEEEVLIQLCKPFNPNQDYTEDPLFLNGPKYSVNWANDAHTLIYVSCGFDALARDCDRLMKGNAGWRLESATGYVLFPGSNHVETVAIFKRRAGREDY